MTDLQERIALPWEFVQDFTDKRLNIARVLDAENRLVCRCSPPDADLIVLAVNAYNGESDEEWSFIRRWLLTDAEARARYEIAREEARRASA